MSEQFPRSPYDSIRGLVYFLRMLDKIRIHAAGKLPASHCEQLGDGFDGRCVRLLGVPYGEVKQRVLAGEKDEAVLDWCLANGRNPNEEEIDIWSNFMKKRGWRDEAHERLLFRIKESHLEARAAECATMFDYIDIDEGRTPPDLSKWEPPRYGA